MQGPLWVITEQKKGLLKKVSLETLSKARELADKLNKDLCAIVLGADIEGLAENCCHHGADKVYLLDHALLKDYSPEGYVEALKEIFNSEEKPCMILTGATGQGKDFAPKFAAAINTNIAVDCTSIEIINNDFEFTRPVYAGKAISKLKFTKENIRFASIRPNVFKSKDPDASKKGDIKKITLSLPKEKIRTIVKNVSRQISGKVELTEARVIVSGGRGMKGPENFAMLEKLAKTLGAAVGASRAAVDAGWIDHQNQVGQTGKTVTPDLYIACGISGAIQHIAGMSSSKSIVAINNDPEAGIFKIADYGIVGDLFTIVPLLTEEFEKLLQNS